MALTGDVCALSPSLSLSSLSHLLLLFLPPPSVSHHIFALLCSLAFSAIDRSIAFYQYTSCCHFVLAPRPQHLSSSLHVRCYFLGALCRIRDRGLAFQKDTQCERKAAQRERESEGNGLKWSLSIESGRDM